MKKWRNYGGPKKPLEPVPASQYMTQAAQAEAAVREQTKNLVETLRANGHVVLEQGDEIYVKPIKRKD